MLKIYLYDQVDWRVVFYGISIPVGSLMTNPFYIYDLFGFTAYQPL